MINIAIHIHSWRERARRSRERPNSDPLFFQKRASGARLARDRAYRRFGTKLLHDVRFSRRIWHLWVKKPWLLVFMALYGKFQNLNILPPHCWRDLETLEKELMKLQLISKEAETQNNKMSARQSIENIYVRTRENRAPGLDKARATQLSSRVRVRQLRICTPPQDHAHWWTAIRGKWSVQHTHPGRGRYH